MQNARYKEMTAKEYLNQVHVMDSRIETLEHTIDEIWTQLTHITADPSKDVVDGTKSAGMNDALIEKLHNVQDQLIDEKSKAVVTRARIIIEIQELDNADYIRLLNLRYIARDNHGKQLEWREVARRMGYEESTIYWKHGLALLAFKDKHADI